MLIPSLLHSLESYGYVLAEALPAQLVEIFLSPQLLLGIGLPLVNEFNVPLCIVNPKMEQRFDFVFHTEFKTSASCKITWETDVIIIVNISVLFLLLILSFVSHNRNQLLIV